MKKNFSWQRRCSWKPSHKKTQPNPIWVFYEFVFFSPSECPGICQHRPGHSLGEKEDELVEQSCPSWLTLFTWRFLWACPLLQAKKFHNNFVLLGVSSAHTYVVVPGILESWFKKLKLYSFFLHRYFLRQKNRQTYLLIMDISVWNIRHLHGGVSRCKKPRTP